MRLGTLGRSSIALCTLLVAGASTARAQRPAASAAPAASVSPDIGTIAPDFSIAATTRYGALRDPVRLSDFRGKTVVLAFFYKARTKG